MTDDITSTLFLNFFDRNFPQQMYSSLSRSLFFGYYSQNWYCDFCKRKLIYRYMFSFKTSSNYDEIEAYPPWIFFLWVLWHESILVKAFGLRTIPVSLPVWMWIGSIFLIIFIRLSQVVRRHRKLKGNQSSSCCHILHSLPPTLVWWKNLLYDSGKSVTGELFLRLKIIS